MSATNIVDSIDEHDFKAQCSQDARLLKIVMSGNADLNVKSSLDRFLDAVHNAAERNGIEEVQVDVRKLEFMNSSCLKCLVGWLSRIQDMPPTGQYRVLFISSPAMYWQKRSLHALSCLAAELVTVQQGE